ncbi:hypothetical protein J2R76_004339 [Bradyrhizobium sp. USDA 4532]|uniref:hypothetical protein n=1 Tax=Bradyrhizobium TaxID=374 RepID=UPI00145782BF|nr:MULTISPECIES: hypothetical protein [Bradyrhizobium]MCA6100212.1 hypothetical protein [Bradyrhizobium australafricanum]MCP1835999.1 hypothetical protein [Bradyrhizobium sp. USDA 4545]MCP1920748.1 hypothetical protein [Bradyrhizobium sp. USDA 4532]NLS70094.1 hypothetical protein [Bradyrhizobium brasilense]
MPSYADELEKQFAAADTTTIAAAPLDLPGDHPLRLKGYSPVLLSSCVCVTDPCPCDDPDGPIVWLLDGDVRKRVAAKGKNKAGEALYEYHLARDAFVIIETFARTKAGTLVASGDKTSALRRSAFNRLMRMRGSDSAGGLIARAPGSSYGGQECGGGTLYDVYVESDGAGGTVFYYQAVGSC